MHDPISYVPVLKSRRAEYWAWRDVSPRVAARSRPVFQVVPNKKKEDCVLQDFVNQITSVWPAGPVLTVDTELLDQTRPIRSTVDRAVLWTSRRLLENHVPAKPVMRLSDPSQVLSDVAGAAALHLQGACLRLGSDEHDPEPGEASRLLPRLLQETGLATTEIDLLIDFRAVESPARVNAAIPIAYGMLLWASINGPWRSVTLLSGASPRSIFDLPFGQSTPCRRHDADLFIGTLNANPPIRPDFGDYGVWHPTFEDSFGRSPHPNLRYAHGEFWHVYREFRTNGNNAGFFPVARSVVNSPHWPVAGGQYSAGDDEILRCSTATTHPGAATQWLQWGGSHHFAHVVDRLTTLGVP